MILYSNPFWPSIVLAIVLLVDALMSIRPPKFIEGCLSGVNLPREWWWILIYIKLTAVIGLLAGLWFPGVGIAANIGVIAYFLAAATSHFKANFLKSEFWINCLGMLALSIATLVITVVL